MNGQQKVSIVIPVFNEVETIAKCLNAFTNQTVRPFEIIIVDNNCTDDTIKIARKYNVRVIKESKQGIPPAVYAGYSEAKGDIIARCDADSIVPLNWIEMITRELTNNPDAAGVTGPGYFYGTNWLNAWLAQVWYMQLYFLSVGSALANWPLFGSNCAIRKSTWLEIRDKIHHDQTDIHDDIDISIHIPPMRPILYKKSLRVGISARALKIKTIKKRYARGFKSLTIHWPDESPQNRWEQRLKRRASKYM